MNDLVLSFNRLPRPQTIFEGLPNHWVFGARRLYPNPPRDLVVAVHPSSRFILQAGYADFLTSSFLSEIVQTLLPILLDAFVNGNQPPDDHQPPCPQPFAPCAWATEDPEMAEALEECLNQHGVANELCRVDTCSDDDKDILEEEWSRLYEEIADIVGLGAQPPRPYCPLSLRGSSTWFNNARLDAYGYYNTTARSSPEAQALMGTLYLNFPSSGSQEEGFGKALRSLVYAGKDTPENMKTLFGPNCSIGRIHEETRLEVLFVPPRGSLSYAIHEEQCPDSRLERSPRPATDAEQQVIGKAREIQVEIRQRIGVGMLPSTAAYDSWMSYDWGSPPESCYQTYMLAVKTLDPVV